MAHPIEDQQIQIDGRLDEEIWKKYRPISGFFQQEPKVGEKELAVTEVWVLYDSKYLYIGARLIDPEPNAVQGDERHRDSDFSRSDTFGFVVDTFHDHQNGFYFETNPLGGKADGLIHQEGAFINTDWDGLWDIGAIRTDYGWSAEFRIPFETIRFQPGEAEVWGIQFRRKIPHLKEVAFWSPLTSDQNFYMLSKGGHLTGIQPISQAGEIWIKPYVKGGGLLKEGLDSGWELNQDSGLDLRYKLKSNLTFDLTFRTDFAETEIDRIQINLTRFPLFYPEKREFFLEGSDYFDFGISGRAQPFFSRTIGLQNQQPVPLFGGMKLTGKIDGYGLGLLSIGSRSHNGIEREEMSAVRFTRDMGLRSRAGVLFTDRTGDGGSDQSGGADLTWGPLPQLDLQGFWVRSGWPNHSLYGEGTASFSEAYWHDPFWRIRINHLRISDGFDPALGFAQQTDLDETYGYVDIHPQPNNGPVREFGFKGELTYQNDSRGDFLYRSNYWRAQAVFRSGEFILLSWDPQIEHLPVDFMIRPGITLPAGDYTYQQYSEIFQSDSRRAFSVTQTWYGGQFYNGNKNTLTFGFAWGAVDTFKIGFSLEQDWVNLPQGNFVAEIIEQDFRWDLDNQMTVQALNQWDKELGEFSTNFRYSWEYKPGSFFYLVINPIQTDSQTNFLFQAKVTYLFQPFKKE
ncbi:MAG: carbohydrate binding family 9 domain-containing protein [Nitrospirae bacterium]|nr:carbohydrate binding family 9 domain-containing protein [Nitrospirota bacterium]MBI3594265.1 carbohydrate binding family 9 domain-containing protein [Nitrospirota bacterium]